MTVLKTINVCVKNSQCWYKIFGMVLFVSELASIFFASHIIVDVSEGVFYTIVSSREGSLI